MVLFLAPFCFVIPEGKSHVKVEFLIFFVPDGMWKLHIRWKQNYRPVLSAYLKKIKKIFSYVKRPPPPHMSGVGVCVCVCV